MLKIDLGFSSVSRSTNNNANVMFGNVLAAAKAGLKSVSEDMERCLSLVCAS